MIYISPRSDLLPVNQSSTEMKTEQILVMCHRFASCLYSSRGQKRIWLPYSLRLHCISYRLGSVSSSLLWLWCVYAFLPLPFGHKSVQSFGPKGSTTSRMAVGQKPRRHSVSESLCLRGKTKKAQKGGTKRRNWKNCKLNLHWECWNSSLSNVSPPTLFCGSRAQNSRSRNSIQLLQRACTHTVALGGPACIHTHTYIMQWPRKVCYGKLFLATDCQIAKGTWRETQSGDG